MQTKARLVRLFFGIFLGVLTVTVGILFIVQAYGIFADAGFAQGGYTREAIGTRFLYICVPFFVWIAAIITGFVLSLVYPYTPKKSVSVNYEAALRRLSSKIPEGSGTSYDANLNTVKSERIMRFITSVTLAVICGVCIIISCIYLFDIRNFKGIAHNDAMFNMFKVVGQCLLLALLSAVVAVSLTKFSVRMELNAVKSLIANGNGKPVRKDLQYPVDRLKKIFSIKEISSKIRLGFSIRRIIILSVLGTIAVVFIILGILNGGMQAVWLKAKEICTECIGLG